MATETSGRDAENDGGEPTDRDYCHELAVLLSLQQREIRTLLRLGLTNGQIASRLGVSQATVKYHVSQIMDKLGVGSRWEAAYWPERPPWWTAAFMPVTLLGRRASAALPLKLSHLAGAMSLAVSAAIVGGLALIGILLAGQGGSDGLPADVQAERRLDIRAEQPAQDPADPSTSDDTISIESAPADGPPEAPGSTPQPLVPIVPTSPDIAPAPSNELPPAAVTPTTALPAEPTPPSTLASADPAPSRIAASGGNTCVITSADELDCWGEGNFIGDLADVPGPEGGAVAVASGGGGIVGNAGYGHVCVLTSLGGVKCVGDNTFGQLGDGMGGVFGNFSSTWVDVPGLTSGVISITSGDAFLCALTSAGRVKCWGSNAWGQLGTSTDDQCQPFGTAVSCSTGPVDVTGLMSGVTAIVAGSGHACAVPGGGGVQCWGDNSAGQLGDGTRSGRVTPVAVQGLPNGVTSIAAGGFHTCAIGPSVSPVCWGRDDYGQLGDGTTGDDSLDTLDIVRTHPVEVTHLGDDAAAIAAGRYHTCVLTKRRGVDCWGRNAEGQLGNGTTGHSGLPGPVVGLASEVTAVAAGGVHSCAITSDGQVKCWGQNLVGQLGDGTGTNSSVPVDATGAPFPTPRRNPGAMAVDCNAESEGAQSECRYAFGAEFGIQVHVVEPPYGGYHGFETRLHWADEVLSYLPAEDIGGEALWSGCTFPGHLGSQAPGSSPQPWLDYGCFSSIEEESTFAGPVLEFRFRCQREGVSSVEFVADDAYPRTYFYGDATNLVPELTNATVTCGPCPSEGCPTATPSPTVTPDPSPPPPATPGFPELTLSVLHLNCDSEPSTLAPDQCSVPTGSRFTVAGSIARLAGLLVDSDRDGLYGWNGVQMRFVNTPGLTLNPRPGTAEAVNCAGGIPVQQASPTDYQVGCNIGVGQNGRTDIGVMFEVDYTCKAPGVNTVTMPNGGPPNSHITNEDNAAVPDGSEVDVLTINCRPGTSTLTTGSWESAGIGQAVATLPTSSSRRRRAVRSGRNVRS